MKSMFKELLNCMVTLLAHEISCITSEEEKNEKALSAGRQNTKTNPITWNVIDAERAGSTFFTSAASSVTKARPCPATAALHAIFAQVHIDAYTDADSYAEAEVDAPISMKI